MPATSHQNLLHALLPIVDQAGQLIMEIYAQDFTALTKEDATPVTIADQRAEELIVRALELLTPDVPIIAEEAVSAGEIPDIGHSFWLVDPLDGTKEFINRNGEFTVNIALIENRQPVLGAVLAPAINRLFYGLVNDGAYCRENNQTRSIRCRRPPPEGLTVVASRSHGDRHEILRFVGSIPVAAFKSAGSSLKLCLVAAGEADWYPRLGRTMEWDIAAGHAIVSAAGGSLTDINGQSLSYGKPDFSNPHFVAKGLC